jgi:hypothetical protein
MHNHFGITGCGAGKVEDTRIGGSGSGMPETGGGGLEPRIEVLPTRLNPANQQQDSFETIHLLDTFRAGNNSRNSDGFEAVSHIPCGQQ